MTLIDELREAKEDYVVGYTEFLLIYHPDSKSLYCFVEAIEDVVYYGSVLRTLVVDGQYRLFGCGGKDGVLKIYKNVKIRKDLGNSKFAFFIDRDFDKLISKKAIYETPYYSVENFYCGLSLIERVLATHFYMDTSSEDFKLVICTFKELRKEFHRKTLILNSFLARYAKIRGRIVKKGGLMPRLKINKHINLPKDLVNKDLSTLNCPHFDFETVSSAFNLGDLIKKKNVGKIAKKLNKFELCQVFRGKFELAFVLSFLKRLKNRIEDPRDHFCSKQYTTQIQFRTEDFITVMSSVSEVPRKLKKYIENRLARNA
jgi:hypothetical protein